MLKEWFMKSENVPRWWKTTACLEAGDLGIKVRVVQGCSMWPLWVGRENIRMGVCSG